LLSTEAPMTVPIIAAGGFVPLLNQIFFEFVDDDGHVSRLHEIKPGLEYAIVISHPWGLYRYRIGDRVRVTHFYKSTPCLEFAGRETDCSDLVGEKLSEQFVVSVIQRLKLGEHFVTLLPRPVPAKGRLPGDEAAHYVALIDSEINYDLSLLAEEFDRALAAAYHYKYARFTGQLHACRLLVTERAEQHVLQYYQSKGMRLGDIKPQALVTNMRDAAGIYDLISQKVLGHKIPADRSIVLLPHDAVTLNIFH
jgi:hypothetical protein